MKKIIITFSISTLFLLTLLGINMNANSMSSFSTNQFNKEVYKIINAENKLHKKKYFESLNNTNYLQHPITLKGVNPPRNSSLYIYSRINDSFIYAGSFSKVIETNISDVFYSEINDSLAFYIYDDETLTGYTAEQEKFSPTWVKGKKTVVSFLPSRQPAAKTGQNISYIVEIE